MHITRLHLLGLLSLWAGLGCHDAGLLPAEQARSPNDGGSHPGTHGDAVMDGSVAKHVGAARVAGDAGMAIFAGAGPDGGASASLDGGSDSGATGSASAAVVASPASPCGCGGTPRPTPIDDGTSAEAFVSHADLLTQMVDLRWLTQLPDPLFTSGMASSHDRLSDTSEVGSPGWFANFDFVLLGPEQSATLLEVDGPGVITRIWSAGPAGTLRIYLDGDDAPTIETPLSALLEGRDERFPAPFSFIVAGGRNLYFPISFARSCRVTLSGPTLMTYYHIGYRRYDQGAEVQPFSEVTPASDENDTRSCVAQCLEQPPTATEAEPASGSGETHLVEDASDGGPLELQLDAQHGGLVEELRLQLDGVDVTPDFLRQTMLSIRFDDTRTVLAPLREFFAAGGPEVHVSSLPISTGPGGELISRWPMPFARTALITVVNAEDGVRLSGRLTATWSRRAWTNQSLYFHAAWRSPTTLASTPPRDWTLASIEGEGLYVGNVLNVVNRDASWWGEGDERIYVDGEAFPSHFGTGTEDYYGYAWCSNERFVHSFIGQPVASERQNFGLTSLYRFHVLDPIPFRRSLRFDLEVSHWSLIPVEMTYDALTFWYARPGSRETRDAPGPDAFRMPELGVAEPAITPGPYTCGG